MEDIALHGSELAKLVGLAKKRDLNFAYCPGNDPKEDVFALDIKRNPDILARVARGEGSGTKVSFGTAKVIGRVMFLTCERELSQLSPRLKKFLKYEKIAMDIVVLDQDGNMLEQDVDDAVDGDATVAPNDVSVEGLKARAVELKAALRNVPKAAQASLVKAYKVGVAALQDGDPDKADQTFAKIEDAVAKLDGGSDPALDKLADVSAVLSKRIDGLNGADAVAKLRAAHGVLEGQIAGGDVKMAAGTAKALGDAIARVGR